MKLLLKRTGICGWYVNSVIEVCSEGVQELFPNLLLTKKLEMELHSKQVEDSVALTIKRFKGSARIHMSYRVRGVFIFNRWKYLCTTTDQDCLVNAFLSSNKIKVCYLTAKNYP